MSLNGVLLRWLHSLPKSLAIRLTKFMLMPVVQKGIKLSGKIKESAEPSGSRLLCYRLQREPGRMVIYLRNYLYIFSEYDIYTMCEGTGMMHANMNTHMSWHKFRGQKTTSHVGPYLPPCLRHSLWFAVAYTRLASIEVLVPQVCSSVPVCVGCGFWGFKFSSSCLPGKDFTHWATS